MSSLPFFILSLSLLALLTACGGNDSAKLVSLSGTVSYEDRLYDTGGFTGLTEMKPVRNATVEWVRNGEVVASTTTDNSGQYTLKGNTDNSYLRVLAQSQHDEAHPMAVQVADRSNSILSITTAIPDEETLLDIPITLENSIAGAFNILDVYESAGEFTLSQQGVESLPYLLHATWEPCHTDGTYTAKYNATTIKITLLGINDDCTSELNAGFAQDSDEYDDDVLWHEYGHYLESTYAILDSPGGPHYLLDMAQDIRLAWSEGWGDYISGAIKEWLQNHAPERLSIDPSLSSAWYIDTGSTFIHHDFSLGHYQGTELTYATNEGAVAKILWDLSGHAGFGMEAIWSLFTQQLPGEKTSDLEAAWRGWTAGADPVSHITLRDDFFAPRLIDYAEDGFEPDDSISNIATSRQPYSGESEYHTLYLESLEGDVDLVPFAAVAGSHYRVETHQLRNGTDTLISILDGSGAVVVDGDGSELVNDNHDGTSYPVMPEVVVMQPTHWAINDGCKLASRIEFTASNSATYYVQVEDADKTLAAGNYGDYELLITENPSAVEPYRCP